MHAVLSCMLQVKCRGRRQASEVGKPAQSRTSEIGSTHIGRGKSVKESEKFNRNYESDTRSGRDEEEGI